MFSAHKLSFLKNPEPSRQLSALEINSIAIHYREKYGITILKNGDTTFSQEIIKQHQEKIKRKYDTLIAKYQNEETKYSSYVSHGFFLGGPHSHPLHRWDIGEENYSLIKKELAFFMGQQGDGLKANLTEDDWKKINNIIKKNAQLKVLFDSLAEKYVQFLIEKSEPEIKNACLSHDQAWEEMAAIQKTLKKNETVGYVYTNGNAMNRAHFEVVLISQTQVVKPISWHEAPGSIHQSQDQLLAEVNLRSPVIYEGELPRAQSDSFSCGTLGLLYLKELLKNDGAQRHAYTLNFQFYDEHGVIQRFFYPSPHVLRYSQSSKYNQLIEAMLVDSSDMQPLRLGECKVATLKKLLEDSVAKAIKLGNQSLVEENTAILNHLESFRARWMMAYDEIKRQRDAMCDNNKKNQYLAYSTRRLGNYVNPPNPSSMTAPNNPTFVTPTPVHHTAKPEDNGAALHALSLFINKQCEHLSKKANEKGAKDKLELFNQIQKSIKKEQIGANKVDSSLVENYILQTATIAHHRRHRTANKAVGFFTLGLMIKSADSWIAYKQFVDAHQDVFSSKIAAAFQKSKGVRTHKLACEVNAKETEPKETVQGYEAYRCKVL